VSDIAAIEDAMRRAWPALETESDEAWLLRASEGISRRSNSVHAPPGGTSPLAERIARAEAFYSARGLPVRFQLSPVSEPGLEEELARRGSVRDAETLVLTAPTAQLAVGAPTVTLSADPGADWLALWDAAEGYGSRLPLARSLLARIEGESAYALVHADSEPVAQARAVVDGPLAGLYAVATRPGYRRRGLARACLSALAGWSLARGAATAYVAVEQNNEPALALYRLLGFTPVFSYWYRTGR
jgi:ribosomal protein S18 acetylase RimI-like enzyme